MRKYFILMLLAFIPVTAFADNPHDGGNGADNGAGGDAVAEAVLTASVNTSSTATAGADASATGVGVGIGEGGNAYASLATDTDASSSNAITIEGDTDTTTYAVPAYAAAGIARSLIAGCTRILGFDFRGSGDTDARGATFGIPLPGGQCQLEKATAAAFELGNNKLGWGLYCSQKAVWKGVRTWQRAITGEFLTKNRAIAACFYTAKVSVF